MSLYKRICVWLETEEEWQARWDMAILAETERFWDAVLGEP